MFVDLSQDGKVNKFFCLSFSNAAVDQFQLGIVVQLGSGMSSIGNVVIST